MKKFLFCLLLLGAGLEVSAQFMSNSAHEYEKRATTVKETPNWFGSIWLSYYPMTLSLKGSGTTSTSKFNGVGLLWTSAHGLGHIPLYLEWGLGLQYAGNEEKESYEGVYYTTTNNLLFLNVPLQLLYRFQIPSTKIAIAPYTGFLFTVPVLWNEKVQASGYGDTYTESSDVFKYFYDQTGENLNRFNMDWQFGVRFMFNHFFLGAAYRLPLVGLYNKNSVTWSFSQADISLGFTF